MQQIEVVPKRKGSQTEGMARARGGKAEVFAFGSLTRSWFGVGSDLFRAGERRQTAENGKPSGPRQPVGRTKTNRVTFFAKVQEWGNGRRTGPTNGSRRAGGGDNATEFVAGTKLGRLFFLSLPLLLPSSRFSLGPSLRCSNCLSPLYCYFEKEKRGAARKRAEEEGRRRRTNGGILIGMRGARNSGIL